MNKTLFGAGLGFRRELIPALAEEVQKNGQSHINFFEIAPENWLNLGGRYAAQLRQFTEQFPFICHGLSLSLGSCQPLDVTFLNQVNAFLNQHHIALYTEHLSWCSDDGHLYDLLPIPCTEEAVHWVAKRIRQSQDIMERQIGIENASYYLNPPNAEMTEAEFINAVVNEAGCLLHLDVNNIYVNSQNFAYDPIAYLHSLPLEKVCYIHVAGHYVEPDGLLVDTHGADVIDPVWALLKEAYKNIPKPAMNIPTCLERDFNFPPLDELIAEVKIIQQLQREMV